MKSMPTTTLQERSGWKKFEFPDRKILQAHVASFGFLAFLCTTFGFLITLGFSFGFLLAVNVVLFVAIFVIITVMSVVTVMFVMVSVISVKDLGVVEIVTLAAEHCQSGNCAQDHDVGHAFHG
jgi:hypothetical protein